VKLIDSVDFIKSEFKDISIDTLTKALKKGASGHYGKTYRMCDQELCIWIRAYLEENVSDIVFKYTSIPCDEWKTKEEYDVFERSVRFRHKQRNIPQAYSVYLEKAIQLKLGI